MTDAPAPDPSNTEIDQLVAPLDPDDDVNDRLDGAAMGLPPAEEDDEPEIAEDADDHADDSVGDERPDPEC